MWVRSLLSQADAKTRSTGAPHSVGTHRERVATPTVPFT
jgi:hypothetical protein